MNKLLATNSMTYVAEVIAMKKNRVVLCLDDNDGTVAIAKAIPGVKQGSHVFCRLTDKRHTTRSRAKVTGLYEGNMVRDLAS